MTLSRVQRHFTWGKNPALLTSQKSITTFDTMNRDTADTQTIDAYDTHVDRYDNLARLLPDRDAMNRFLAALPAGGTILDFGCGTGAYAGLMQSLGFAVTAIDASAEMVRRAQSSYGVTALQRHFDQLAMADIFDGIWANFSLLHAKKTDFPGHLQAVHTALRDRGFLHIAMKTGRGTFRDKLGRFYALYSRADLARLLDQAEFDIIDETTGCDAGMAGITEPWIAILARRR